MSRQDDEAVGINVRSKILSREMEGYSLIQTMDQHDILETLKILNMTSTHAIYLDVHYDRENFHDKTVRNHDLLTLALDIVRPQLNEPRHSVYMFARNESLFDLSIDELEMQNLSSIVYLQVEMNKHFTNLDTFAIYNVYKACGLQLKGGFL